MTNFSEYEKILNCISFLPKKLISLHSLDNATEFIFHSLCHSNCFDLKKAAYFVDNPDFDFIKGITGYCKNEEYLEWNKIWEDIDSFSSFMKKSQFNSKVRNFVSKSPKRNNHLHTETVDSISKELGFINPSYHCWEIKHLNHGLLVYEKDEPSEIFSKYFINCLYLLGLCPIF